MKAVVFDFYGTLAETPSWGPSWVELVAELGYELLPEIRDRWWNDGIDGIEHDEHSQSRDHYVAWQQARVRGMLTDAAIPESDQDLLITRVREISGHRQIQAYPEVAELLGALRARGYALGICSNWDWDLTEAIESAGLTDTTDLVVSSAWVGARKPHARIYHHTLDQLGVEPESVLFVGDTWACDVEGPTALGMRAVYVRRPHLGPDATAPEQFPETDRIHRVTDLTTLDRLCD